MWLHVTSPGQEGIKAHLFITEFSSQQKLSQVDLLGEMLK